LKRRLLIFVPLLVVLLYGLQLRVSHLGCRPFLVDEAESCINALTILQHGYPGDHYLGLPLYENILTEPWPDSGEYEFKDSSYSSRAMAIYHGWAPLYAIATAFAVGGIEPNEETAELKVKRSLADIRRLTFIARLPSAVLGVLFLLLLYSGGNLIGGRDVAWAALLLGTFMTSSVELARMARYFSASLLLGTACGITIWLMARRGRWSHFISGAMALALLFHTHIVTFLVACALFVFMLPFMMRHLRAIPKLITVGMILTLSILPWVFLSGFHERAGNVPMAWSFLTFPGDFFYPLFRFRRLALAVVLGLVCLPVVRSVKGSLPERLTQPFLNFSGAHYFLATWFITGCLAASFLFPAASYFLDRIFICLIPPGIFLMAVVLAATARTLIPRYSSALAACLAVALLCVVRMGTFHLSQPQQCNAPPQQVPVLEMIEELRARDIEPGTKIYATPNNHLILALYTGLPVQSIAPVRKSFLDSCEKGLLILECVGRYYPFSQRNIQRGAREAGVTLSRAEASEWGDLLPGRLAREDLLARGFKVLPPREEIPDWMKGVIARQRQLTAAKIAAASSVTENPAIFRGYSVPDFSYWWPIFFYRFVHPEERMGSHLNYAERARRCRAVVLSSAWVIYESQL